MKLSEVQKIAESKNLSVQKYNPGGNLTYKVIQGKGKSYFEGYQLFRSKSLKDCYIFVLEYKEE